MRAICGELIDLDKRHLGE